MWDIPVRCSMVSIVAVRSARAGEQVLLLRRASDYLDGVWSYVAGHLEPGETAWQCALRELDEETGLVPAAFYTADFCEQYYDRREECIAIVPAFVAFVTADAEVSLNTEHSAARWMTFDEATPLLPFGGQRDLFKHVRREFIERTPMPALRIDGR